MVDLDSDPTKLIETVEIGKQLLMTRGALTTFSIANDVAKYFAISGPVRRHAALAEASTSCTCTPRRRPSCRRSSSTPSSFRADPDRAQGGEIPALGADALLRRNLLVWGLGGVIIPSSGSSSSTEEFFRKHGFDAARPLISVLPGSRRGEAARHLPALLEAVRILDRKRAMTSCCRPRPRPGCRSTS